MIDFYRKSVLSQLGKDAGNQSMSEYIRNISNKYESYLSRTIEQKIKYIKANNLNIDKIKGLDTNMRKIISNQLNQSETI
jgi:hypothetical protein